MSDKIKKGQEGEEMAARFLLEKGYEIVERNYRHKKSEIDLIVKKANWLIFVEVKLRSSDAYGYPEDFVDYKRRETLLMGPNSILTKMIGKEMCAMILCLSAC